MLQTSGSQMSSVFSCHDDQICSVLHLPSSSHNQVLEFQHIQRWDVCVAESTSRFLWTPRSALCTWSGAFWHHSEPRSSGAWNPEKLLAEPASYIETKSSSWSVVLSALNSSVYVHTCALSHISWLKWWLACFLQLSAFLLCIKVYKTICVTEISPYKVELRWEDFNCQFCIWQSVFSSYLKSHSVA